MENAKNASYVLVFLYAQSIQKRKTDKQRCEKCGVVPLFGVPAPFNF